MKQLIFKIVITFMAYFTIGYLISQFFSGDMEGKWKYVISGTFIMALTHLFVIIPIARKINQDRLE